MGRAIVVVFTVIALGGTGSWFLSVDDDSLSPSFEYFLLGNLLQFASLGIVVVVVIGWIVSIVRHAWLR